LGNFLRPIDGLIWGGQVIGRVVGDVDCDCFSMVVCRNHLALLRPPRPETVW
jgi:hypothetical protein